MSLDFPARYDSVQYPFGFYLLNFGSRILTADDTRTNTKVELHVIPIYRDNPSNIRNILCEVETSRRLKHDNLLSWLHLFSFQEGQADFPTICLSFPSASTTLLDIIGFSSAPSPALTHDKISWILYQLTRLLHYFHCCGQMVVHLPLKNVHVSMEDGTYNIKLQDFGWKYHCIGGHPATTDLKQSMRFSYKWNGISLVAPEVLTLMPNVDQNADMWNLGCIMAMMLVKASPTEEYPRPIICCPGEDSMRIVGEFLGKAPEEFLSNLNIENRAYFSHSSTTRKPLDSLICPEVDSIPASSLHTTLSTYTAKDLLDHLMVYPSHRLSSEEAIKHAYFAPYFHEDDLASNLRNKVDIPEISETFDSLDGYESAIRLHRKVASHELRRPLEVYRLQDLCLRVIEKSYSLEHFKKMTYPKVLINRVVQQSQLLVS